MRKSGTKTILYASGSGVYGDLGEEEADEDYGPLLPISTYGASKLAGEVLITSYCHMFEFTGRVFRFGNVVGPRQTHGVGFDFLRQLLKNPRKLTNSGRRNPKQVVYPRPRRGGRSAAGSRALNETDLRRITWPQATTSP